MDSTFSSIVGVVCAYFILTLAGCATAERDDNWLREKIKDGVCEEPEVLIIIEQGSCESRQVEVSRAA